MDKEKQTYILQVAGVAVFALLLLVPVMWYAKKAQSPEDAITQEQLKSFESDDLEFVERDEISYQELAQGAQTGEGMRGKFSNIGTAIVSVNINNIVMMTPQDLENVGATPFSLSNTVMTNLNTPQVIEVVFDNEDVLRGFASRKDVYEMTSNYLKLYDIISSQSFDIDKFVNGPAVQGVLRNEMLLRSLLKSKLMTYIFNSPAGKYYLGNPARTKQLLASNTTLAPYLKNQTLKQILSEIPATQAAAAQIFD